MRPSKATRVLVTSIVFACAVWVSATNTEQFVADLDAAWTAHNFAGLVQAADSRLATYPNDLAALLVKMQYHLMIDYNLDLAQEHVEAFTNTVAALNWEDDKDAELLCRVMVRDAIDPTSAQDHGIIFNLTTNQLLALHSESPTNYPLSDFLLRVGGIQYSE